MIVNNALIHAAGYGISRRRDVVEAAPTREPLPDGARQRWPVAQVIEGDWLGGGRLHEYEPRPRAIVAVSPPDSFETTLAMQRHGLRQYEALSLLEGRASLAGARHFIDTYA